MVANRKKRKLTDTFAIVLMKCRPGLEDKIRTRIEEERQRDGTTYEHHICLRNEEPHSCVRKKVTVITMAYCFGPFDFLFVVRSREVHDVERYVVECIRGNAERIEDTHTIVGIAV